MNLVKTSYKDDDVTILLQNVEGKVPLLDIKEREKLNQEGVHYSEMLPIEYVPTEKYMKIYQSSLENLSYETAVSVAKLSEKIYDKKGEDVVLVSLARAGTPIGILIKRYLKFKYKIEVAHYSISIIRGKGIDICAMNYITKKHNINNIQFVDGWVGKGAISKVLKESLIPPFDKIDSTLAVLSDPTNTTDMYGTRQDFLIPSACLNATISGLISRTVKTKDMTDDELHGAVYYGDYTQNDKSYEFIEKVCECFSEKMEDCFEESVKSDKTGFEIVAKIAEKYGIKDINKVKPGVGETTRVLLRRLPDRILVNKNANQKYLELILQLCNEKNILVEYADLELYSVCGIIKEISDL